MAETAGICLLADVPQAIPTLAGWYKNEWPAWYAEVSPVEMEADLAGVTHRDRVPFALVAVDAGSQPVGVCAVRDDVFEPYPHVGPWLRGLYVHPAHRNNGVAGKLIAAAGRHAAGLGLNKLYAATYSAIGTFERAGWLGFDQASHGGKVLTIFAKRISCEGEVAGSLLSA